MKGIYVVDKELIESITELHNNLKAMFEVMISEYRDSISFMKSAIEAIDAFENLFYSSIVETDAQGIISELSNTAPGGPGQGPADYTDKVIEISGVNQTAVAIPRHVANRIASEQQNIDSIMKLFYQATKLNPNINATTFDIEVDNTISNIATLLKISHEEARIIFKMLLAKLLSSGEFD